MADQQAELFTLLLPPAPLEVRLNFHATQCRQYLQFCRDYITDQFQICGDYITQHSIYLTTVPLFLSCIWMAILYFRNEKFCIGKDNFGKCEIAIACLAVFLLVSTVLHVLVLLFRGALIGVIRRLSRVLLFSSLELHLFQTYY